MNATPALEARALTKRFGTRTVIDGLDFVVRPGTLTGFLGANGAGKSTTMRLFMGLDRPTAGAALIRGRRIEEWPVPGRTIGAALSNRCAHPGRTALDSLRWIALLLDIPEGRCHEELERVGLGHAARRRTGEFSYGMRQRLALAQAMLGDPEILLLDEPMNGLDPQGITWLRDLLTELRERGRTVLIASHLLREIEGLVDDLIVIDQGRIVSTGSVREFLDRYERETVTVRCEDIHTLVGAVLAAGGQLLGPVRGDRVSVVGLAAREIGQLARDRGLSIEEMSSERRLEKAYQAATGGDLPRQPTPTEIRP